MPRPLFDSEYLYGFHDPGGEHIMLEQGIPGWVLLTKAIGRDPQDMGGDDFSAYSGKGPRCDGALEQWLRWIGHDSHRKITTLSSPSAAPTT